jgi:hypothetical protein
MEDAMDTEKTEPQRPRFRQRRKPTIFPGVDTANDHIWSEREYLGIYRIVFGKHRDYPKPIFMVWNQDNNTGTELSAWLRS